MIFFYSRELSRFIAAGRLHAKIDKVNGIVETNRPDSKNWQYQVIKIRFLKLKLYFLLINSNRLISRKQSKKEIYY